MESFEACDRAMHIHQNPTYGKVQSLFLEQDQGPHSASSVLMMLEMVCEVSSEDDDDLKTADVTKNESLSSTKKKRYQQNIIAGNDDKHSNQRRQKQQQQKVRRKNAEQEEDLNYSSIQNIRSQKRSRNN